MTAQTPRVPLLSAARSGRWERLEPFLAALVFLLPIITNLPFGTNRTWALVPVIVVVLAVLVAGLALGLPRWSMPVIGILLFLLTFFGLGLLLDRWKGMVISAWAESDALDAREAYALIVDGLFWLIYLLLTALLVAGARLAARAAAPLLVGKAPRWWAKLRDPRERDWSALSFLIYGANAGWLLLAMSDYDNAGPLVLIVVVVLIAGVLSYLRSEQPRQRIVALVAATLLAGAVHAAGKWALVPSQQWDVLFLQHPPETERWFAAIGTLHNTIYISILLALPAYLLKRQEKSA